VVFIIYTILVVVGCCLSSFFRADVPKMLRKQAVLGRVSFVDGEVCSRVVLVLVLWMARLNSCSSTSYAW